MALANSHNIAASLPCSPLFSSNCKKSLHLTLLLNTATSQQLLHLRSWTNPAPRKSWKVFRPWHRKTVKQISFHFRNRWRSKGSNSPFFQIRWKIRSVCFADRQTVRRVPAGWIGRSATCIMLLACNVQKCSLLVFLAARMCNSVFCALFGNVHY